MSQESGFFGIGADYDKIREIRNEKSESCEQLKRWNVITQTRANFYN
jgi:DnaJ family protein B protein 12